MPSDEAAFVDDLADAIIAKFKLDATPQQVQLIKLDGVARILLDPMNTLGEAGVTAGTKLEVAIVGQGACRGLLMSFEDSFAHPMFTLLQLIRGHFPTRNRSPSPPWVIRACTAPVL